jgi:hypothetical protein
MLLRRGIQRSVRAPSRHGGRPLSGLSVSTEDGEIVVDGPSATDGYFGRDPVDGAWRTGDLGVPRNGGNSIGRGCGGFRLRSPEEGATKQYSNIGGRTSGTVLGTHNCDRSVPSILAVIKINPDLYFTMNATASAGIYPFDPGDHRERKIGQRHSYFCATKETAAQFRRLEAVD